MFWLPLSLVIGSIAVWVIDWRRLRETLPAALVTVVYYSIHTGLPTAIRPVLAVTDRGPLSGHWPLTLLAQMLIAPTLALWYAQGLKPGAPLPWVRTAFFVVLGAGLENLARLLGCVVFAPWWHPAYSLIDAMLAVGLVRAVSHIVSACGSPRRLRGGRSAPLR